MLIETYSVLTRLPAPQRLAPSVVGQALAALDRPTLALEGSQVRRVVSRLSEARIGGGAVYDGLVAATAAQHDLLLLTLDRRAAPTYDVMGARYDFLS